MKRMKYFLDSLVLSIKIKTPISLIVSIVGLGTAFLPTLISLQLETFTNGVQQLYQNKATFEKVIWSFAVLGFLYMLQELMDFAQRYCAGKDAEQIKRYMKEQMIRLLSSVPYKYIENFGDFRQKVDFVNTYAAEKTAGSISMIFKWIANILSFIGVSVILYRVNEWIVLVLIVTCIPAVILSMLQRDETYRHRTKFMKEGMLVLSYSDACRSNEPMKEIRFFGLYPYLKEKWKRLGADWMEKKKRITRKHLLYNGAADLLRNGVYLGVVLLAARAIYLNPALGLGSFMLVLSAAKQLQAVTTEFMIQSVSIFADMKYMEDFFQLLETAREETGEESGIYEKTEISLENVSFSYPNSDKKALNGLNVHIRAGEKIAVVGANGSGKSTFVNLLCGLYPPESGAVRINGENVCEHLEKIRNSTSVVFQNFCQYQDTVRNNIIVSDLDGSNENDNELRELMKKTGVDEVLGENGSLDDMIGLFSENGLNLSGGQWQKLAITRALQRRDATLYILDEPTSALDPISEANIYQNFASLTGDKTTILVSHRLGITSVVDRILVFDRGRIVEDGSLDELLKRNGIFAGMYRAQAKWYVEQG